MCSILIASLIDFSNGSRRRNLIMMPLIVKGLLVENFGDYLII